MNSHPTTYMRKIFPRQERLKSRTLIKLLFSKASARKFGCIKLLYTPSSIDFTHQVLFSVHKSKIPKAHYRNTIKRRMREAYRLNKHLIYSENEESGGFLLAFVYLPTSVKPFADINRDILSHLKFLQNKVRTN